MRLKTKGCGSRYIFWIYQCSTAMVYWRLCALNRTLLLGNKITILWSNFLDFFHPPKNKITTTKITTFRKLVLLPPSPENGRRTTFRNVVILIAVILFFGRWKKSKNPLLHNNVHRRQNLLGFTQNNYRHGTLQALYITRSSTNQRQVEQEETTELYGFSIADMRKRRSLILAQIKVPPTANNVIRSTPYSIYHS
jgi:hypothetical protein